eukprot:jgi/Psemu1/12308/gm1.12308_g
MNLSPPPAPGPITKQNAAHSLLGMVVKLVETTPGGPVSRRMGVFKNGGVQITVDGQRDKEVPYNINQDQNNQQDWGDSNIGNKHHHHQQQQQQCKCLIRTKEV